MSNGTVGEVGWNENWSTRVNQEFERRFPVPISGSTTEHETGRQHGAREC